MPIRHEADLNWDEIASMKTATSAIRWFALCLFGFAPLAPALAQDSAAAPDEGALLPGFRTIDEIMEQAVRNIAARYNLNHEQQRYTENMMKTEVRKFLRDHHAEIWPVLRTMISAQLDPNSITKDTSEAKRIGKMARPLFAAAQKAILDSNNEWREILTDDQRAMHDFDLQEMSKTFQHMDSQLSSWESGQPGDKGIFPSAQVYPGEPARPSLPPTGLPNLSPGRATSAQESAPTPDVFEAYVEAFIKDYELDAGQIERARTILAEFKLKAEDHYKRAAKEIAKAETDRQEAVIRRDRAAREAAEKKRKELNAPPTEYFGVMKDRLHALLTTAQKERYAQKQAEKKAPAAAKPAPAAQQPAPKPAEGAKAPAAGDKPATPPKKD